MWEDFDKGHVAGARNVPYYLSVTPHGTRYLPTYLCSTSIDRSTDRSIDRPVTPAYSMHA
jgi:hypothetical protein